MRPIGLRCMMQCETSYDSMMTFDSLMVVMMIDDYDEDDGDDVDYDSHHWKAIKCLVGQLWSCD